MVPSNMTSFSQSWKTRCLRMTAMEFFGDAAKSRFLLASFLQGVLCLCRERGGHHPTIVLKGQAGQLKSVGDVNVSSRQITKQRWIWEHLEIQKHVAVECILQVTTKKHTKKHLLYLFLVLESTFSVINCHPLLLKKTHLEGTSLWKVGKSANISTCLSWNKNIMEPCKTKMVVS